MKRLLALVLLLGGLVVPPAAAAGDKACHTQLPTSVTQRPVVLVHGWNSSAAAMEGLAAALRAGQPKGGYFFYCFDYASRATHWPKEMEIHQALADAIVSLSRAYRKAGGDGHVLAAGHSMGGIALRYASQDTAQGVRVADVLAGVVTFGTPHTGSPWGDTGIAAKAESLFGTGQQALPPSGSDAARCLASLARRAASCGQVPYLPQGVALTQLGTQITVRRTLFDIGIAKQSADIQLFGDGIVPQDSSSGYLFSGPSAGGSRKPPVPGGARQRHRALHLHD